MMTIKEEQKNIDSEEEIDGRIIDFFNVLLKIDKQLELSKKRENATIEKPEQ